MNGSARVGVQGTRSAWQALLVSGVLTLLWWSATGTGVTPTALFRDGGIGEALGYLARGFPPDLSPEFLRQVARGTVETLAISVSGTALAVVIALSLAFFATRTVLFDGILYAAEPLRWRRLPRVGVYLAARAMLNVLRTVPEIVWALIFVFAVGLGPFPGVLALGVHTGGVLGKLFSEVVEDVRPGPLEALQAGGASRVAIIAYGILPQALPHFLSYSLYRWEVNIRAAAVLGFVGAGGLGQQIHMAISLFLEDRLLTLILAIYVTVTLVDVLSARLRATLR